jgi:hypothetical protein
LNSRKDDGRANEVGEVGLRGEETRDLKEDEQGEQAVMVVMLGASEEESGTGEKSERLYIRNEEGGDCVAGGSAGVWPCGSFRGKTSV